MRIYSSLKRLVRWSPFHPSFICRRRIRGAIAGSVGFARGHVIDLGCGSQPYQTLFEEAGCTYTGTDIQPRRGVGFTSSALALPLKAGVADTLLSTEMLEHVPDPFAAAREMFRVLKSGGRLILTTPQTWGLHSEPHDFYRFTRYGLRQVLVAAGFRILRIQPYGGLFEVLGARLADGWAENLLPPRSLPLSKWGWRLVLLPVAMIPVPFINVTALLLDRIFHMPSDTLGHLALAEKPEDHRAPEPQAS